ncbi:MAPEG family protein [Bradyrhizobium viridifuturi]|uniref:MAPEG family protein n=1 Tax=Bradyrhizobium viridifuturi TaxID=1654716 RepID=UPI00067ED419|nr:MAPEG family protein [Bradyrhizobium viridifuturi]
MYHYTAIVTCLAVAFYFFTSTQVARARVAYGVKLPAISGHPDFERIFRIQMNTLEWMPIFLPSLWLFANYVGDAAAAAIGAIWVVGRIVYFIGYREAAAKRSPGFAIQAVASVVLWVGAIGGAVWRLAH